MSSALRLVARRVGVSVLVLVLSSMLIFVVLRVIPGDPTQIRATQAGVTAEQLAHQRQQLGLDLPIPVQYVRWLGGVVQGDFGESYFSGLSAGRLITGKVGATVHLVLGAVIVALAVAIPAAVASALRPNSVLDRAISAAASAGIAMPPFWLAILLIGLFSVQLGWFPTRGYVSLFDDPLASLRLTVLPVVTLATFIGSMIFRFLRSSLNEVLADDFIRTARGKGLLWREAVVRHALPNGFLPTLTFVGLITGSLLGGAVVIEFVFGWSGVGALVIDAVSKRDYPIVQAVALLAAAAFLLVTLLVDLLALVLDPRLRAEEASS